MKKSGLQENDLSAHGHLRAVELEPQRHRVPRPVLPQPGVDLGFHGRIVVSEIEIPNMLVHLVQNG
jgi:hypothetical protein